MSIDLLRPARFWLCKQYLLGQTVTRYGLISFIPLLYKHVNQAFKSLALYFGIELITKYC